MIVRTATGEVVSLVRGSRSTKGGFAIVPAPARNSPAMIVLLVPSVMAWTPSPIVLWLTPSSWTPSEVGTTSRETHEPSFARTESTSLAPATDVTWRTWPDG